MRSKYVSLFHKKFKNCLQQYKQSDFISMAWMVSDEDTTMGQIWMQWSHWKSEKYLVCSLIYGYEVSEVNSFEEWISHSWIQWHCLGFTSAKLIEDCHFVEYSQEERSWWTASVCFWKQSRKDTKTKFLQSFETILWSYCVGQRNRQ